MKPIFNNNIMKKVLLILLVIVSTHAYSQNFDTNPIGYMDSLVLKNPQPTEIVHILPPGFKVIEQTYKYVRAVKKINSTSHSLECIYKNSNLTKIVAVLNQTSESNAINDINNLPYKKMGTTTGVNPENTSEYCNSILYCRNDNLTMAEIVVWNTGSVELYVREYQLYD